MNPNIQQHMTWIPRPSTASRNVIDILVGEPESIHSVRQVAQQILTSDTIGRSDIEKIRRQLDNAVESGDAERVDVERPSTGGKPATYYRAAARR